MGIGQWIGLVIFVVCLYICWQIRQVLLLIFTAVVLATALNRLVQLFQRFRIQRGIAIFLSIGLLLFLLCGFFINFGIPTNFCQLFWVFRFVPSSTITGYNSGLD